MHKEVVQQLIQQQKNSASFKTSTMSSVPANTVVIVVGF